MKEAAATTVPTYTAPTAPITAPSRTRPGITTPAPRRVITWCRSRATTRHRRIIVHHPRKVGAVALGLVPVGVGGPATAMVLAPVGVVGRGPAAAIIGHRPALAAAMAAITAVEVTTVAAMDAVATDTVGARPRQWL